MTFDPLDRSRVSLAAARHLQAGGFFAATVSRAYYAAFYAAEAAIGALGETRSKHAGVVATFNKLVIKAGAMDESVGESLRILFEDRNEADYAESFIDAAMGNDAITRAERVIEEVAIWLARRGT